MHQKIAALFFSLLLLTGVTSARAGLVTVDFEDLVSGPGFFQDVVPIDYHGLIWTDWTFYNYENPPYVASSGDVRIFNSDHQNNAVISFGQAVTFMGSYAAGYSHGQYWAGFSGGVQIYASTPQSLDGTPFASLIENLNWTGVDQVKFISEGAPDVDDTILHNYYVIDDLKFIAPDRGPGTSPVPDRTYTAILFGVAAFALAVGRRRKSEWMRTTR